MVRRGTLAKPIGGFFRICKHIVANEGVAALWRSNVIHCAKYFPTQALNFTLKPMFQSADFLTRSADDTMVASLAKGFAAGGLAGGSVLLLTYPLDIARIHLINDLKAWSKPPQGHGAAEYMFSGSINVYKQTLAANGARGLFRGLGISLASIVAYRGLYFGLYDIAKPFMGGEPSSFDMLQRFAVGYATTVLAGVLSYPLSTIRNRMIVNMSMTPGDKSGVYSSSLDCASKIIKGEGFLALFKGAGINVLKGVAGAALLSGYDMVKSASDQDQGNDAYD